MTTEQLRIPFTAQMEQLIRVGRKTATTRTRRYGCPGDILKTTDGLHLRLIAVAHLTLRQVAIGHFDYEGFDSPKGFEEIWKRLHPRAGWVPDQMVWYHVFEVVAPKKAERSA